MEPRVGIERTAYTALANVIMAIGFSLLVAAAMAIRARDLSWKSGLLWGLIGYMIFFVAPSLGLPPELPGSAAALVGERQTWWLIATAGTGIGMAAMIFGRHWLVRALGVIALVGPHAIGAPKNPPEAGLAPETLAHSFIAATVIANLVFWLALGGLSGTR